MARKSKAPAKITKKKTPSSRKHTRFAPDLGAIARIDINEMPLGFDATLTGLIIEESYNGCGLVLVNDDSLRGKLKVGDRILVQVGKLSPLSAEIRWRADLDSKVLRLGLMYIE